MCQRGDAALRPVPPLSFLGAACQPVPLRRRAALRAAPRDATVVVHHLLSI